MKRNAVGVERVSMKTEGAGVSHVMEMVGVDGVVFFSGMVMNFGFHVCCSCVPVEISLRML